LLTLRLVVGHGSQKLFGWFGGYGIRGTGGWLESIGVKPGAFFATVAGLSEFVGVWIWFASSRIAARFGDAYEYNLVLLVLVVALAFTGAGGIAIGA
jgi:putative oxidoreductase